MSQCPYIDGILIDKRLPRWNLVYLYNLKRILTKYNFSIIFDLQNSSRTRFYRKFYILNCRCLLWLMVDWIVEFGVSQRTPGMAGGKFPPVRAIRRLPACGDQLWLASKWLLGMPSSSCTRIFRSLW